MNRSIVTIVGGGAFAPKLCEALATSLPPLDLRLVARDAGRLAIIAGHAARSLARLGRDAPVAACTSLADAVAGARAVILLLRVGGLAARAHDEELARRFGLAGDEGLGVGGIANAYRTVPVLTEIAATLREHAPRAAVINLVAPLGITTRLLLDEGVDATGVCELPLLTLEAMARAASVTPCAVRLRYAGLNHLGWFWDVRAGGVDVLERAVDAGLVDAEVLARTGGAPLPYYYDVFDRAAARRLGRVPSTGRARLLGELSGRLVGRFARSPGAPAPELDERPTPWFERAVVPMLRRALTGAPLRGFADVRGRGLVRDLPDELVVEVAVEADGSGVRPVDPGPLPHPIASFLSAVARAEDLSYRAARARSPALVAEALRALPLPIAPGDVAEIARLAISAAPTAAAS